MPIQDLLKQIYEICLIEDKRDEERRRRGEDFNIFSILNLSTSEVRLHSTFLSALLDPKGDHGLGDSFLKTFIEICTNIPIERFDTQNAKVNVEYSIPTNNNDDSHGGRIDILITDTNKNAIVIENKIYAGDVDKQLTRYANFICEQKFNCNELIYLTLDKSEPSDTSIKDYPRDANEYICLSYREDIILWLEKCAQIAYNHSLVRETIKQYISTIQKLTDTMNDRDSKQKMTEIIMSSEQNIKAALDIMRIEEELKFNIRQDFLESLKKKAKDIGFEMEGTDEHGAKYSIFRFYPIIDNKIIYGCRYTFCIELTTTKRAYFGIKYNGNPQDAPDIKFPNTFWKSDSPSNVYPYANQWMPDHMQYWNSADTLMKMRANDNEISKYIINQLNLVKGNHLLTIRHND